MSINLTVLVQLHANLATIDPQLHHTALSRDAKKIHKHQATRGGLNASQESVEISYTDVSVIGNGSFGVVYEARLITPVECKIAIKKVYQDKRFKVMV